MRTIMTSPTSLDALGVVFAARRQVEKFYIFLIFKRSSSFTHLRPIKLLGIYLLDQLKPGFKT